MTIPTGELIAHTIATLTAHHATLDDELEARNNRDNAIRALAAAGMTVPDIDHAINGALSRSMLRLILGKVCSSHDTA